MITTSKIRNSNSLVVPQGRHFINRMLQLTDKANKTKLYAAKSRRDDTIFNY